MALVQTTRRDFSRQRSRRLFGLIIAGAIVFFLLAIAINAGAYQLAPEGDGLTEFERATVIISTRNTLLQLLVGLSLLGGLLFTARTYSLSRAIHRTDSFAKAIEHIGNSGSAAVRAGGAYSLGLLARSSPSNWPMIEELLASFVRERAIGPEDVASDVQAALTVLGNRPKSKAGRRSKPLDLRGIHVPRAELSGLNLERARLDGAMLSHASFVETDLYRASFSGACLDEAKLIGASLVEANLRNASLRSVDLYEAKTARADVTGADLFGAKNLTAEQRREFVGSPTGV